MGFLKGIGSLSLPKSRPTSSASSCRARAVDQADVKNEAPWVTTAASSAGQQANQVELLLSPDNMRVQIRAKEVKYKRLADQACERLLEVVESNGPEWSVWEDKRDLLVDKSLNCLSGSICGRGRYTWAPSEETPYDFDFAANFLWDDKTKPLYDEFTREILVLIEYEDDYHILNQLFHGRFGISGRDFVVAIHKRRFDTETHERLIIGAVSVPKEEESVIDNLILNDEVRKKHLMAKENLVRGFAFTAGFCLTRDRTDGKYCVTYVHDADVRTQGVPQWIVNRVKLDQLRIVKEIPRLLQEAFTNS